MSDASHVVPREQKDSDVGEGDMVIQGPERVFLVGATLKRRQKKPEYEYSVQESLEELGRLAETAGLEVHPHWVCVAAQPSVHACVKAAREGKGMRQIDIHL